jgi:hypothetical protein
VSYSRAISSGCDRGHHRLPLSCGGTAANDSEDVVLAHDEVFLAIQDDLVACVLA